MALAIARRGLAGEPVVAVVDIISSSAESFFMMRERERSIGEAIYIDFNHLIAGACNKRARNDVTSGGDPT